MTGGAFYISGTCIDSTCRVQKCSTLPQLGSRILQLGFRSGRCALHCSDDQADDEDPFALAPDVKDAYLCVPQEQPTMAHATVLKALPLRRSPPSRTR